MGDGGEQLAKGMIEELNVSRSEAAWTREAFVWLSTNWVLIPHKPECYLVSIR